MAVANSRDDEIRLIWTENQWLYLVAGFLGGILFCLLLQLSINNLPELVINLLPEAAGIFITVTVIDVLNRRREKQNAIKELQEQLVRDASSIVNDVATNAAHQLDKRDWLSGHEGLLKGENLIRSNLQGAFLHKANMQQVNLFLANLRAADLSHANLREAKAVYANLQETNLIGADMRSIDLVGADLQRALLVFTNLQHATLIGTKLQNAALVGANLQGANLQRAMLQGTNLEGANLENSCFGEAYDAAEFDETTILPDGTFWTPETDMTRFTNPKANS